MVDIPKLRYPDFHDWLVRDVCQKRDAGLALVGQPLKITAALEEKKAASARLTAFNRGELTPAVHEVRAARSLGRRPVDPARTE